MTLKAGIVAAALVVCTATASADTVHFSVPVSINSLRLVTQAQTGAVDCFVAGYSIAPLDVAHARNLKGQNIGSGHQTFSLTSGSYQGTVDVTVDIGSHSVADMKSWYCALRFDAEYAWGFQHDLSAPYTPESFANVGPMLPTVIHQTIQQH